MLWPRRADTENLKIISVGALDGDTFGITLESGHTILLELGDRIHEPAFAALIKSGDFCKPCTDGQRLCWPGGMSMTLKEILDMLLCHGNAGKRNKLRNKHLEGGYERK